MATRDSPWYEASSSAVWASGWTNAETHGARIAIKVDGIPSTYDELAIARRDTNAWSWPAAGYAWITLWTNDVLASARWPYQEPGFDLVEADPHHATRTTASAAILSAKTGSETWTLSPTRLSANCLGIAV